MFLRNSFMQPQLYTVSQHRRLPSEVVRMWKKKCCCFVIQNSWKLRPRQQLHNLRNRHYTKPIRGAAHLSPVHYTGVLISPQPDLLPDVFCLMVRVFLLMLVLLYIGTNSTNIPPIMIINRIYEHQTLLSLQLVSFLVGLRTYQHPCTTIYLLGFKISNPSRSYRFSFLLLPSAC